MNSVEKAVLETLDDYKARQPKPNIPSRYRPTGVACPNCGNEMVQDTMVVLTSMPPKKLFVCQSCGQNEYV